MNRTSNLNNNAKTKPIATKHNDYAQVDAASDSFGQSTIQVRNRSNNNTFTSANHSVIRNGDPPNSTTPRSMPKTGKERHAHSSYRAKESDHGFPKSHEDNKPKYYPSYSRSYNNDGRGNSNQPPTKSPVQVSQSFSKSYLQGTKAESVNSDSGIEAITYQQQQQLGNHKGKLFTQPFVPQSQYQSGQQRQYSSSAGRQQQQQAHPYYSSSAKYLSTSPILTVEQSPVSIHVHPHSLPYTSAPHPGHYQYPQSTNPASPQPIHPQLSPSLPAPSAPIPIPQSWTAPGITHYYAIPTPVYDSQQMQYHQYHPQYHAHSPHTTSPYAYYPNQPIPVPAPHNYQHQQNYQPSSPLILQKSPSDNYTSQVPLSQHASPQPRTSKAIPIINPDTMTPVQADARPSHSTSSNSNDKKVDDDKKDGKPATTSASAQFIDPAIKEQEEREQQEKEEQIYEQQKQQEQQAAKEKEDGLAMTTPDDVASKVDMETASTTMSELQNVVEITSIGSIASPKISDSATGTDSSLSSSSILQHTTSETIKTSSLITKSTDENNADVEQDSVVLASSSNSTEKDAETNGVIQYDPAFLMQFMPLCLDTTEDLSSFQNILDSSEHGRCNIGGDKRQHFGNGDRNVFRPNSNGNNGNKNYSRSAPAPCGISILANQMTAAQYPTREGRSEMGKFIGGRTLTGRTNNNSNSTNLGTTTTTTTTNITSSNINNLINASINNATAFGGDSSKTQRDGSFGGRTKYTTPLSGRAPPHSNGNNKRYPHHDHYHHHQQCGAPTIPFDQVAPLEKSANRWVPSVAVAATSTTATTTITTTGDNDNDNEILTQEEITRKIKGLLNKLTLERFDTISDRIIRYAEQSTKEDDGQSLRTVIQLIFEKACDEAAFASMWAQLCRKLYEWIPADIKDVNTKDKNGEPVSGNPLYCKYLFSRCQYEFEKGWKSLPPTGTTSDIGGGGDDHNGNDDSHQLTSDMVDGDNGNCDMNKKKHVGTAPGEAMWTEEYYTAVKIKRRGLGLVQFIGELYCRDMLSQRIMYQCLKRLCDSGAQAQEEEVESLCKLLTTIGADIDRDPQTATWFEVFFQRMQNDMYNSPHLSSRVKFMIMDVVDLRKNNWVPRNGKQDKPKTIAEIHEDAEKAKLQEKEAFAKRSGPSRGSSSILTSSNPYNGASRQNYRTSGKMMKKNSGPGAITTPNDNNGWNTVSSATNPSLPRHHDATDYSNFGRTERARPRNTNLVPSYSPFASLNRSGSSSGDDNGAQNATLRRKPSSTLNDTSTSNKSTGPASNMFSALEDDHNDTNIPKKLALLPRGSTLPQQRSTTEQKQVTSITINNTQLKRRIKNILAEYYELADIKELFTSIKEVLNQPEAQSILSTELLAVVEMKEKQVIAVGELIPQLYKDHILDKRTMVKAFQEFMHGYEDLVIDVPQAPTYTARLLIQANIGLSEACVDLPLPTCLEKVYTTMSSP